MIQYRFLECVERGHSPVCFGVAFRDTEGVFLFVPEWRSPQPLPVTDLSELNEDHVPKTAYLLRWAPDVWEWEEGPDEDFDPAAVLFGKPVIATAAGTPPLAVRPVPGKMVLKHSRFPSTPGELADLILGYTPLPIPWYGARARSFFQSGVANAHIQLSVYWALRNKHHFCEELAWLAIYVVVPNIDNSPRIAFNFTNELLGRAGLFPRQHNLVLEDLLDRFCRITQQGRASRDKLAHFLHKNWEKIARIRANFKSGAQARSLWDFTRGRTPVSRVWEPLLKGVDAKRGKLALFLEKNWI